MPKPRVPKSLPLPPRMMRRVGYADMSLRDLAAQVNMKAGSLYYHFASKDELATEVMRIGVEAIELAVRTGLEQHADSSPFGVSWSHAHSP